MRLRYETGIATMTQFLVITLLNFVAAIIGSITGCHAATNTYDCASGAVINLLYVLILAMWFGFIWVLGYAAQDRRDHRLARFLMGAEFMVLVIALFNAKHFPNILGLISSLIDAAFAIWVIYLAFRLSRAKGGRITKPAARARRRPVIKKA